MCILCLVLILCLLCGCGGETPDSAWLQADGYTISTYNTESQDNLSLKSNGDLVVGAKYDYQGDGALYTLSLQDGVVSTEWISDFQGLQYYNLLGVDGDNGIFITGTNSQDRVCVLRLDEQGQETLRIDMDATVPDQGVYSFTWDAEHYYFLVNRWSDKPEVAYDSFLEVYDHQGQLIDQRDLAHSLASTAGYLPQEDEWMEELEGREEDLLLSQLFPEGPQDSVGLLRLGDGTLGMLICRKSPIDGERYGILCPMDAQYAFAPACYYPIVSLDGWPLTTFFESREPEYALLINTKEGLMGLSLDGSATPLFAWSTMDFSPQNLTAMQPGTADDTCTGPGNTLWIRSWNMELDGYDLCVLTPNP